MIFASSNVDAGLCGRRHHIHHASTAPVERRADETGGLGGVESASQTFLISVTPSGKIF